MDLKIFTDGGARGNPGPAAIGVVIKPENGGEIRFSQYIGNTTNNVAEYTGVLKAFEYLLHATRKEERGRVHFFLDSQLVTQQLKGIYKVKEVHLKQIKQQVEEKIIEWGSEVTFSHIPREKNSYADALVNRELDKQQKI